MGLIAIAFLLGDRDVLSLLDLRLVHGIEYPFGVGLPGQETLTLPDHPVFPEGDVPEQILACPVADHRLGESLVGDAFDGVDPGLPATFGEIDQLTRRSWVQVGRSSAVPFAAIV